MRLTSAFLARALLLAAALFALWSPLRAADLWAQAVIAAAEPAIYMTTGFQVSRVEKQPEGLTVFIEQRGEEGPIPLQPHKAFSGLLPFLALVGASPALSWRRRLAALGIGTAVFFVFHAGLLLVGTLLSGGPQTFMPSSWIKPFNIVVDLIFGFYGLIGFVALPFLLWLWLCPASRGLFPFPNRT